MVTKKNFNFFFNFNNNTKKSIFLKKVQKFYTRCLSPLLSLEKFWSFGGGLDKGFYGKLINKFKLIYLKMEKKTLLTCGSTLHRLQRVYLIR